MWRKRLALAFLAVHTLLAIGAAVTVAMAIPDNGDQAAWVWVLYIPIDLPAALVYMPLTESLSDALLAGSTDDYLNLLLFPTLGAVLVGGAQWAAGGWVIGAVVDALARRSRRAKAARTGS